MYFSVLIDWFIFVLVAAKGMWRRSLLSRKQSNICFVTSEKEGSNLPQDLTAASQRNTETPTCENTYEGKRKPDQQRDKQKPDTQTQKITDYT